MGHVGVRTTTPQGQWRESVEIRLFIHKSDQK